ncbi:MAG: hypothetical protein V1810_00895 [Candidatus Beckwithbacteria bacterium]
MIKKRSPDEIWDAAFNHEALTPDDVKTFFDSVDGQLGILSNLPDKVSFSLEDGAVGRDARRKQLNDLLIGIGIGSVEIGGQEFAADEIWDAVCYELRREHSSQIKKGGKDEAIDQVLNDDRGRRIKQHSKEIVGKIGGDEASDIINIGTCLINNIKGEDDVDPLSLTGDKVLHAFKKIPFQLTLHSKQGMVANLAEVDVGQVLIDKRMLERWEVIHQFLTQRVEGRIGKKNAPKFGESQTPYLLSFNTETGQMMISGVAFEHDPGHLTVVEVQRVLEETDAWIDEASEQILGGIQGWQGWMAEAKIRKAHQIWSETSKSIQKELPKLMTHLSDVGHGHFIAEAFEIPDVGKILAMPDWYQQRDPLTDKPLEIDEIYEIEETVKAKAAALGISSSKVDLGLFLTQLLQIGYWTGKVGLKHRNILERYGLEQEGTGLPIGTFNEELLNDMDETARKAFELQVRDLAQTVVGTCLDWGAEHLRRLVDNAWTDDTLYRMNVGEPPIYDPPEQLPAEIIKAISEQQATPEEDYWDKTVDIDHKCLGVKSLLRKSYLHREQYRWMFVPAWFGDLYVDKQRRLGKQAVEKQFMNPDSQQDRKHLINRLTNNEFARATLQKAGMIPEMINDAVVKELFTDDNMVWVNAFREKIMEEKGTRVELQDVKEMIEEEIEKFKDKKIDEEALKKHLATALEFVLRDKRTWNVDMGGEVRDAQGNLVFTNSRFINPTTGLTEKIRKKGFSANEAHLMVTAEDFRWQIHQTFGEILSVLCTMKLNNEFPDVKGLMSRLTVKYGDDARFRQGTLTGPWLAMETALSLRAATMMRVYYLMGYHKTGGDWTVTQQHLYDRMDINRILHERLHPVIGASQRIYGINRYEKLIRRTLAKLRAAGPSEAIDIMAVRDWSVSSDMSKILSLTMIGGDAFGLHSHCVREIGEYGQDIGEGLEGLHLDDDVDYLTIKYEREAQELYYRGSEMTLTGWKIQAEKGDLNREAARKQIDQYAQIGFMRRWYEGDREKVGLGDKFKVEFETLLDPQDEGKGKRMEIFPIDFMVSLRRQAYSVSIDWAQSHGYILKNGKNPTAFWYEGKAGRLTGDDKESWEKFRSEMLKGWMINVQMDDSQIPTYYWEWRKAALGMVGLDEVKVERLEDDGMYRIKYEARDKLKGQIHGLDSWDTSILKAERDDFRERLKTDPIPKALAEVEEAYCAFILRDVGEILMRKDHYRGMSMNEKAQLEEKIIQHYAEGHINEETRELLLSRLVETRYESGFMVAWKDWKNIVVNDEIPLSPLNWGLELGVSVLEALGIKDIKKGDWYQWQKTITIPSLGGWTAGLLYSGVFTNLAREAAMKVATNISVVTNILNSLAPDVLKQYVPATLTLPFYLDTIVGGLLAAWVPATVATWIIRGFNRYVTPKFLGGKRWASGEPNLRRKKRQRG